MTDLVEMQNFLPIEGDRIRLSLFTESNITNDYLSWLNDPDVTRFSNQRFMRHTRQSSLNYLKTFYNTKNIFLAIYLKDEERYIGTVTVYVTDPHHTADIGIMIGNKDCWGKGVGREAWCTILNWLLSIVKIRKVTGGTLRCNKGMVQIMINSGMRPDGVRIAQEFVDGSFEDMLYFAKFKDN